MKLLAIVAAIALAGCAYQSEVVTANPDQISVKAGRYANPGDRAAAHCGQYGKTAVLVASTGDGIYQFACR